jgi:hypothetical protein
VDPVLLILQRAVDTGGRAGALPEARQPWDGSIVSSRQLFVTGVGASTTYPDYKPAPFIVSSQADGVDMVTVVTEGIFSYCSLKLKIDTDRWLGPEQAAVRCKGEVVGHVTTAEYGSQMLSLGGVHHLTGGSKKEGRHLRDDARAGQQGGGGAAPSTAAPRCGCRPAAAGRQRRARGSACAWAAARPPSASSRSSGWAIVDEVVVVDDHITGVLTEHQAGRCLDMKPAGMKRARPQVHAGPLLPGGQSRHRLGRHRHHRPAVDHREGSIPTAWPGLRLLMVSTTGEHAEWYVLDEQLQPAAGADARAEVRGIVDRIGENCEPSLCTVLFMGGAGGSLRAGVTENPVLPDALIKDASRQRDLRRRAGLRLARRRHHGDGRRARACRRTASAPCPPRPSSLPIEFSMRLDDYRALGGHMELCAHASQALATGAWHNDGAPTGASRIEALAGQPLAAGSAARCSAEVRPSAA